MKSEYAIVNHFLLDFQALGGRQFCNFSFGGRRILQGQSGLSTYSQPNKEEDEKVKALSQVFLLLARLLVTSASNREDSMQGSLLGTYQ